MPMYERLCGDCKHTFSRFLRTHRELPTLRCPACNSKNVEMDPKQCTSLGVTNVSDYAERHDGGKDDRHTFDPKHIREFRKRMPEQEFTHDGVPIHHNKQQMHRFEKALASWESESRADREELAEIKRERGDDEAKEGNAA